MIEKARTHFTLAGSVNQSDPAEWQKLHEVEIHKGDAWMQGKLEIGRVHSGKPMQPLPLERTPLDW